VANWKFDAQHILLILAFVVGVAWATVNWFSGKPLDSQTFMAFLPVAFLGITNILSFLKSSPADVGAAAAAGQSVLGNQAKRGFSPVGLLAALAVVGVLGALVCAPRPPVAVAGCSGALSPSTSAVIVAADNLALCTYGVIESDESATPPVAWPQVLIDEGTQCATQAEALLVALGEAVSTPNTNAVVAQAHALSVARYTTHVKGH
jgi:hypothetical protein